MRAGLWAIAAALVAAATPAQAVVVADFELNGTLANGVANGVTLSNKGGTLGASGIAFGLNQGPVVSGLSALSAYTIDMGFTLDRLTGTGGTGYVKLIDFSNLASDNGYYSYNGLLNAYPLSNSASPVFAAGAPVRLTLSRNTAGLITAYIDGTQIYSQPDAGNASATAINGLNPLTFFTDDVATGTREAASGFVDYIRIFDTAITPGEATPVPPATPAVPEPASWATMLLGCGSVGGLLRRRRAAAMRVRFA